MLLGMGELLAVAFQQTDRALDLAEEALRERDAARAEVLQLRTRVQALTTEIADWAEVAGGLAAARDKARAEATGRLHLYRVQVDGAWQYVVAANPLLAIWQALEAVGRGPEATGRIGAVQEESLIIPHRLVTGEYAAGEPGPGLRWSVWGGAGQDADRAA